MDAPPGPFTTELDHPAVVGEPESSIVTSGIASASRCAPAPIPTVAPALDAFAGLRSCAS
jgi:hypothetical protein